MHIFSDILHFDMSLLLLTVTLRGVSNKHCLLSLFSFEFYNTSSILGCLKCKNFTIAQGLAVQSTVSLRRLLKGQL